MEQAHTHTSVQIPYLRIRGVLKSHLKSVKEESSLLARFKVSRDAGRERGRDDMEQIILCDTAENAFCFQIFFLDGRHAVKMPLKLTYALEQVHSQSRFLRDLQCRRSPAAVIAL
jgi:hypothetical protein